MENKFTENLKLLRKDSGYSQRDLAKLMKTSQRRVSHLERGETEPDIQTLIEIANLFDVTVDYLIGRTDY